MAEAYLESSRISMMELFRKNSERLQAINYFRKKTPSLIFDYCKRFGISVTWVLGIPCGTQGPRYSGVPGSQGPSGSRESRDWVPLSHYITCLYSSFDNIQINIHLRLENIIAQSILCCFDLFY